MKTIAIAGPKGGLGKSLTTCTLAVCASLEAGKVAMLDMNEDQATLTEWWVQRGRPISPYLYNADGTLDELVENLRAAEWDYCLIDGPPYDQDLIEMMVIVSDAVIVPVKLSYFDVSAVDSIVGMCQRRKKPYGFIINEFDDRSKFAAANEIALRALNGRGKILNTKISYDPKHRIGQVQGKTGPELDIKGKTKGPIARQIDALWAEAKELAGVPALRVIGGRHG